MARAETCAMDPSLLAWLDVLGSGEVSLGAMPMLFRAHRNQAFARRNGRTPTIDELRAMLAAVDRAAIIAITDARGRIEYANEHFVTISGYARGELLGENHRILNSGHHPRSFWKQMYKSVAAGGIWRAPVCNRAKAGDLYWVDTTICGIRGSGGRLAHFLTIRFDITEAQCAVAELRRSHDMLAQAAEEQAHLNAQLRLSQDQLSARNAELTSALELARRASQAKGDFLANMSHEIRTPLTAILGFAEMLGEHEPGTIQSETYHDYVRTIRRQGQHLLAIVNDVLDIAKVESGHMVLDEIDSSPRELIGECVSDLRPSAEKKGLRLEVQTQDGVPERVLLDPMRTRQILVNLIANAIKFTERGGVSVALRGETSTDGSPWVCIDVCDTGIGIAREQMERVFEMFQQGDGSTTRRFGGTGLGLSISRRLARLMHGDIHLRSEEGVGSVFTLRLPARLAGERGGASAREPSPVAVIAGKSAGLRVLLAEDSADNVRLIRHHLRKLGARVEVVDNGEDAVRRVTRSGGLGGALIDPPAFDVILMDMQMPRMDGYTAAELLRGLGSAIPIVAITAHAGDGDREKCLKAGCSEYLAKPIDPGELRRVIKLLTTPGPRSLAA